MYSLHLNFQVMVSTECDLVYFLICYCTVHSVFMQYLCTYIVVHGAFVCMYLFSTLKRETAYNKCSFWIVHVWFKPQ
jgi:hypothetical protein